MGWGSRQSAKLTVARSDRSRNGKVRLRSADQLSKQVGPPEAAPGFSATTTALPRESSKAAQTHVIRDRVESVSVRVTLITRVVRGDCPEGEAYLEPVTDLSTDDSTGIRGNMSGRTAGHRNFENFTQYVDSVLDLVQPRQPIVLSRWDKKLASCLDGEPQRVLREQVPQPELRRQGAFFTGPKLARRLASTATAGAGNASICYDPACGAGDLLLAIAQKLPLRPTFSDTLNTWGTRLAGCDVSSDFVRLARARLTLLAAKRCRVRPPLDYPESVEAFPNIRVADSLAPSRRMPNAHVIVMNPPFGYATAPSDCVWSSGRVNLAALFVDRIVADIPDGTRIVALLPDVLRSGSRYVMWRKAMRALGCVIRETPLGLFDPWTDVDVYLLHFKKNACRHGSCEARPADKPTYGVGKRFNVHVGPVVPHRDREEGPNVRYIHARSLRPWAEWAGPGETRQFSGRLFDPPFVTVRRTSRPDGGNRAVATLVLGNGPVAVENHLIVLLPKNGTVQSCRQLLLRLRSPRTDDWLDSRLRCRHLTTRALAEMPWWYKP